MNARGVAALACCALLGACGATRSFGTGAAGGGAGGTAGIPATAGTNVGAVTGVGAAAAGGTAAGIGAAGGAVCDPTKSGAAPLVMLEGDRQQEAVRAALGATAASLVKLPQPTAMGTPLGVDMVSTLHENAHLLALELTTSAKALAALTGCQENDDTDACRDSFIQSFGARAYRRALTDDDTADLRAWFDTGEKLGGDFASGARAVVEVALQSPDFLYVSDAAQCGGNTP